GARRRPARPRMAFRPAPVAPAQIPAPAAATPVRRSLPIRAAFAGTFVMLFFAGAALTAGAGDRVAGLVIADDATTEAVDAAPAGDRPDAAGGPPAARVRARHVDYVA